MILTPFDDPSITIIVHFPLSVTCGYLCFPNALSFALCYPSFLSVCGLYVRPLYTDCSYCIGCKRKRPFRSIAVRYFCCTFRVFVLMLFPGLRKYKGCVPVYYASTCMSCRALSLQVITMRRHLPLLMYELKSSSTWSKSAYRSVKAGHPMQSLA